jgi:hypothetical protein
MSPRALAATLPKITKAVLEKGGRDYAAIVAEWPQIVGSALGESSLPEKLAQPRTAGAVGGVLTITVSSGAAMEFQHREPQILERINAYLGRTAVTRLKLIQGPVRRRAVAARRVARSLTAGESQGIESAVGGVTDPELKARLARFGRSLAAAGQPSRR